MSSAALRLPFASVVAVVDDDDCAGADGAVFEDADDVGTVDEALVALILEQAWRCLPIAELRQGRPH